MQRVLSIVWALLAMSLVSSAKSQKADFYSLSLSDKPYPDKYRDDDCDYCFLYLLKDGRYCIELEWDISDDIICVDHTSMGNYSQKGDTLYFKDDFTSYRFEAVIKNEKITFLSGFPFMIGRTWDFEESTGYDYDSYASSYEKHRSLLSETNDSIAFKEPFHTLEYRPYVSKNSCGIPTIININEDETYSIVYGGVLFSQGKWVRIGNFIRLKDNDLNRDHYALIKENEIVMYTIEAGCLKESYK